MVGFLERKRSMKSNHLDVRDAPRDEQGRLIRNASYRDSESHVTSREVALTQPSLAEKIYMFVRDQRGAWVSRAEIAKAVNLKKTPYLHTAIEALVSGGWIEREMGTYRHLPMCFYRVAEKQARTVQ